MLSLSLSPPPNIISRQGPTYPNRYRHVEETRCLPWKDGDHSPLSRSSRLNLYRGSEKCSRLDILVLQYGVSRYRRSGYRTLLWMVKRILRQTSHERRLDREELTTHKFQSCHIVRYIYERWRTEESAIDSLESGRTSAARASRREHVLSWREGAVSFSVQRILSFPLAVSAERPPTCAGYIMEDGYDPRQNLDFGDTSESSGFIKH